LCLYLSNTLNKSDIQTLLFYMYRYWHGPIHSSAFGTAMKRERREEEKKKRRKNEKSEKEKKKGGKNEKEKEKKIKD
jgi:hypothetical protein